MSEESLSNQLRAERHRKRRKRTSRNLEDFGDERNATRDKVALQDLPDRGTSAQLKNPSSGNSNSVELNDDRRPKSRRTRKRTLKQNVEIEGGVHSVERKGHRRPPKTRMNRSVSEEVLEIQREMDEAQLGVRRMQNLSRKTHGIHDPSLGGQRTESDLGSTLPKPGESRHSRPKRSRAKPRLSQLQNTSAEEENYQGDLDDEASFSGGFKVDKEDVVIEECCNVSKVPAPVTTVNSSSLLPSQPLDVLFIERKDGEFKKEHKDKLAQTEVPSYEMAVVSPREPTTSDFAMSTHRAFKVFALFCHGLLGGFAFCQCLFVYSLSSPDNFLQNYCKLSQHVGSIYYFLLAVCTVSVFDSYGIVKSKSGFFQGLLTSPTQTLALFVYMVALIFTLSVAMIDDRISLYDIDTSLWEKNAEKVDLIDDWKIINLMRVLGSVLGWILLAIQPSKDYMAESFFDDHTSGKMCVPSTANHVVGCDIGQIHQRAGYNAMSP